MAKCGVCMGRGSFDDPPWGIVRCTSCNGTGRDSAATVAEPSKAPKAAHEIIAEQARTHELVQFADRAQYVASFDPNSGPKKYEATQQQAESLWDRKGNVRHDAIDRFSKAREQMHQIEKEHDAKSEFQREVEKMGQQAESGEGEILRLHTEMAGLRQMLDAANVRADQAVALSNHLQDKLASQQAEPVGDERAAFEAWVSASGRAHLLERDEKHGYYKDLTVTAWWTAWQARAAQSGQRAGVVEDAARYQRIRELWFEWGMHNINTPLGAALSALANVADRESLDAVLDSINATAPTPAAQGGGSHD